MNMLKELVVGFLAFLTVSTVSAKTIYRPVQFNDFPELTASRSVESDNFVIYWGEKCGADPTTASDPALRFSPPAVLTMLESFYNTYITSLGVLDDKVGNISTYKFIIIINDSWNNAPWAGWAFGGAYDGVIGAMWVHPGACKTPSSTLAHELAHSLQNQAWIENPGHGFINYEPAGSFWESHANFMMTQHYTAGWAYMDLTRFLNTQHFHFSSTRHHYGNSLFLQYMEDKRGIEMINRLWREATPGSEHPLQTYMRLTGMSQSQLNDEFGEYAQKNVNFDYSAGPEIRHAIDNDQSRNYLSRRYTMLEAVPNQSNTYKVPYYMAPQDYGYNIIQLNPNTPTATVDMRFRGQPNPAAGGAEYRFSFVASDGSATRSSPVYAAVGGAEVPVNFAMQAGETELYLVVLGAPASHHSYMWEEGWPKYYRYPWQIQITGATPFVNNHKGISGAAHPNGGGFVANTATVADTAYVGPNACVLGNAHLQGTVRVLDMASATHGAVINGDATLRHAAWAASTRIESSAVIEETCMQIGGTVGGSYVGGGDQEGHGDATRGIYKQVPHPNNGRTVADGLTVHAANDDINPTFTDYVFVGSSETIPPTPNPATFTSVPVATGSTKITMTATAGTDANVPIEYYFAETSGNPGATDSGWQTTPSYTDSGLATSTQYSYTVQMRDSLGNTGVASSPVPATTGAPVDPFGTVSINIGLNGSLTSTDVAGYYAVNNWNSFAGTVNSASSSLVDSTGSAVYGMSFSVTGANETFGALGTADKSMISGWVANPIIHLAGIPYATYDLVIYYDSWAQVSAGNSSVMSYALSSGGSPITTVYAVNMKDFRLEPNVNPDWDSFLAYSVAEAHAEVSTGDGGYYLVVKGSTASSLDLVTTTVSGTPAGISGIQIIGTAGAVDAHAQPRHVCFGPCSHRSD